MSVQIKTETHIEFVCAESHEDTKVRVNSDGRVEFYTTEWGSDDVRMAIAAEDIPAFLTALGDLLRG